MKKHYLLASDFDQTLSFNDSGIVLSEMLGIKSFREKVAALSSLNLVQQGAELAYLLANDPEYGRVTRNDLLEVGRRVRLKRNVELLTRMLDQGIDGNRFDFYVISAAPEEVVLSALDGIVPADHVVGTRFEFQPGGGQIGTLLRVAAGYGKVAAVEEIRARHVVPRDQVVYVGDGQSDIPVMLHVNRGEGFTIAASAAREIAQIAKRTVISDGALSTVRFAIWAISRASDAAIVKPSPRLTCSITGMSDCPSPTYTTWSRGTTCRARISSTAATLP